MSLRKLQPGLSVLLLLLLWPAGAQAATSWTSLPAPWYAPTISGNNDDSPAYRLHTGSAVSVVGGYAYTVESTLNRITIADVSDPASPVVVGSLQDAAHMDTPVWIVVRGRYAYVTSKGLDNTKLARSSLSVYDVSDPTAPAFVGSVTNDPRLYGAYGLAVTGSTAYIAAQGCVGGANCVSTHPGGNALTIVDVSDPANPSITGSVSSLPATQHLDSVAVVGNRAYGTAFYARALTSFDVSDPAHPSILGSRADARLKFANDVQVQGRYAYVVDQTTSGARLTTVDVSDPTTMPVIGSVLDDTRLAYAYRLRINSRFAFVAAPRFNGMTIVDLANPAAPAVVASVADPVQLANPIGIDLAGDTAYVLAYCPMLNGSCDPAQHGSLSTVDVSAFGDGAPDTAIVSAPAPVSTATSATFTFNATRRAASFDCSLDGAASTPCTSPQTYAGLAPGNHTFAVTATSLAGVVDPTPATSAWTVNQAPPDTSLDSGPPAVSGSATATFSFSATGASTGFVCQLDSGSWTACSTPDVITGLPDGSHTFAVAATGPGGTDPSPATQTWTVDTTAPRTTIRSAPSGTTTATSASIVFDADDPAATFTCSLDGAPAAACTSPQTYSNLAAGGHTVTVTAADVVGNVEAAPPSASWTVGTGTVPDTTITSAPSGLVASRSATLAFTSDDPAATFECRLDGGGWSACTSPRTYTGLVDGGHTVAVRAKNAAGADPSPASATWTVDATAPTATIKAPGTVVASVGVTLSEPVANVTASNVTLRVAGASAPVPATLKCQAASNAAVACSAGPTTKVTLKPASPLIPGQNYVIDAAPTGSAPPTDAAGNGLQFKSVGFRAQLYIEENSAAVAQNWATVSDGQALGGDYLTESTPGASLSYRFVGKSVAWDTITGPGQGTADFFVDGQLVATVDNSATAWTYGVRRPVSGLSAGAHTLLVTARGTGPVIVDGFDVGASVSPSPAVTTLWQAVSAAAASGGQYARSVQAGSSVAMTFRGTRVNLLTTNGPAGGRADVSIDGTSVGTVDTYASSTAYGARRTFAVPDGVHTIVVTVLGTSNGASSGTEVAVDKLTVS